MLHKDKFICMAFLDNTTFPYGSTVADSAYPAPIMRVLRAADTVLRPTDSTRMLLAPALQG